MWNAVDRRDALLAICIAFEAAYVDKRLHRSARMRYSSQPAVRENPHSLSSLAGVALGYIAADGLGRLPPPTSELTRSGAVRSERDALTHDPAKVKLRD